ncbi:hypothetical protein [Paenibacillus sp. GCM10027626]|uniref:hypothetical protein n=1 Tax=Paenibacillus sp. GCM10027626 TaxID=3273411 RepID=UPI00363B996B
MGGYQHYVRTDTNGIVIYGYTTGFELPDVDDILLPNESDRHFCYQLYNDRGQYRYKIVQGKMVERSQAELDAEWNARPPVPKTPEQQRIEALEEESTVAMLGLAEVYEQKETEVTNALLATAELYELLLDQQATIEQMQAEIDQLKVAANGV